MNYGIEGHDDIGTQNPNSLNIWLIVQLNEKSPVRHMEEGILIKDQ